MNNRTVLSGVESFSGSGWHTVKTGDELAAYFGCKVSDVLNHVIPIAYNADTSLSTLPVDAHISSDGSFKVDGNSDGSHRARYFLAYV